MSFWPYSLLDLAIGLPLMALTQVLLGGDKPGRIKGMELPPIGWPEFWVVCGFSAILAGLAMILHRRDKRRSK